MKSRLTWRSLREWEGVKGLRTRNVSTIYHRTQVSTRASPPRNHPPPVPSPPPLHVPHVAKACSRVADSGSREHARQFSQRFQLPPAVQSAAARPTTCATNHLTVLHTSRTPLLSAPFRAPTRPPVGLWTPNTSTRSCSSPSASRGLCRRSSPSRLQAF